MPYYSRTPISLGATYDDVVVDVDSGHWRFDSECEADAVFVAPPLNQVDWVALAYRIRDAMNPVSNGHRRMTLDDWNRLDEAIRKVILTAGN